MILKWIIDYVKISKICLIIFYQTVQVFLLILSIFNFMNFKNTVLFFHPLCMNFFGGMNSLRLKIRLLKRMMVRFKKIFTENLIQLVLKNLKHWILKENLKILKIKNFNPMTSAKIHKIIRQI